MLYQRNAKQQRRKELLENQAAQASDQNANCDEMMDEQSDEEDPLAMYSEE